MVHCSLQHCRRILPNSCNMQVHACNRIAWSCIGSIIYRFCELHRADCWSLRIGWQKCIAAAKLIEEVHVTIVWPCVGSIVYNRFCQLHRAYLATLCIRLLEPRNWMAEVHCSSQIYRTSACNNCVAVRWKHCL